MANERLRTVLLERGLTASDLVPGGRARSASSFAFDPVRRAVLLVAGDKSGNWRRWFDIAIPLADDRYDAHLAELESRDYQ